MCVCMFIYLFIYFTSYPNVKAITAIRNPKKSSNFLKPYLSNNKNVKVSITVISTPPHIGILNQIKYTFYSYVATEIRISHIKNKINLITYALFVNKDKAIAVPITSCISLPIIAISIIIHKIILGIFLYCL